MATPDVSAKLAAEIVDQLSKSGQADNVRGMARYGINPTRNLGVPVTALHRHARALIRRHGRDHALALALWQTGYRDARLLAAMIDEPRNVTPRQMDDWVRDIDSWDVCDGVCGKLFDRTPWAWNKARIWSRRRAEFTKRAGLVLMANLAVHDKQAADDGFLAFLPAIAKAATDDRNLVKKAASWALRQIGKRNHVLHRAALDCAAALRRNDQPAARWVGADVSRELNSDKVRARLAAKAKP